MALWTEMCDTPRKRRARRRRVPSSVAALSDHELQLPLLTPCRNRDGYGAGCLKLAAWIGRGLAATGEGRTPPAAMPACLASKDDAIMTAAVLYAASDPSTHSRAGCEH